MTSVARPADGFVANVMRSIRDYKSILSSNNVRHTDLEMIVNHPGCEPQIFGGDTIRFPRASYWGLPLEVSSSSDLGLKLQTTTTDSFTANRGTSMVPM